MDPKQIYLDYNATTPVVPEVAESMETFMSVKFGNPSANYAIGQEARVAVDKARGQLAYILGSKPDEIFFTSGGTESDNMAVMGIFLNSMRRAKGAKAKIVTCATEHKAVLETCRYAAGLGAEIAEIPVDGHGVIDLDAFSDALDEDTILVSVMLANNETGTVQPLSEITALAHEQNIPVHSDAVQALGKIPVDVAELGVDLLSVSAHKIYGPKAVGALFAARGLKIDPLSHGGSQEMRRRAGTENVHGIVGFGTATELAAKNLADRADHMSKMRDLLEKLLLEKIPGCRVNGSRENRIPNTLNISFCDVESESLLIRLDLAGVATSSGAACSSGAIEASHVLKAMKIGPEWAGSSIRFSTGIQTTGEEISRAADIVSENVHKIRKTHSPDSPCCCGDSCCE